LEEKKRSWFGPVVAGAVAAALAALVILGPSGLSPPASWGNATGGQGGGAGGGPGGGQGGGSGGSPDGGGGQGGTASPSLEETPVAVSADGRWLINSLGIGEHVLAVPLEPNQPGCDIKVTRDQDHGLIWEIGVFNDNESVHAVILWRSDIVASGAPKTEKGIGLGSTRKDFDLAYPDSTGTYFAGATPNNELWGPRVVIVDDVPITFRFDEGDVIYAIGVGLSIFEAEYCVESPAP